MNNTLLQYMKLSLEMNQAGEEELEDSLLSQLDYIWYHEMSKDDYKECKRLLSEEYEQGFGVEEALRNIIQKLEGELGNEY